MTPLLMIIYIIEGMVEYSVDGETITVSSGQIILFNELVEHSSKSIGHLRIILLQFKLNMLRDFFHGRTNVFDGFFEQGFKYISIDAGALPEFSQLPQLMLSIAEEFNNKAPAYEFEIISNILKILTIILRSNLSDKFTQRKQKPAADAIIQYIADNYNHDIKISDVASHFYFSTSYFSHLSKEISGTSFVKYLNEYRINVSKNLLMNPNNTITYAMLGSGFSNRSYYNRLFKKTTGFSPREFRENFLKTQKIEK